MSSSREASFTRGRSAPRPRSRSSASIACQPSAVTASGARSASSASIRSRASCGRLAQAALPQVLGEARDRLLGVALVGAEDAGRAALDPADGVDARERLALRGQRAAGAVGQHEGALVERHVGQRHRPVADGAQDEAGLDRLDRAVDRAGAQRAVVAADELVAAHVDGLHAAVAADLDRRGQEAQLDPARRAGMRARPPDPANSRSSSTFLRAVKVPSSASHCDRDRVELDVGGVHVQGDAVEPAELAQLGAREGGLRGPAAAEHDDLLDPAGAQRLERVVGDVGARELVGVAREDADHVGGDVAVADHDGARARRGRTRGRGSRGGRCTRRRTRWPPSCPGRSSPGIPSDLSVCAPVA